MSRMTTRTTIGVCVGLLALATGVVLVRALAARSRIELSFVRYSDDGVAVLKLTNPNSSPVYCGRLNVMLFSEADRYSTYQPQSGFLLKPRSEIRVSAWPPDSTVSMQCKGEAPDFRDRVAAVLAKVGIRIASEGYVVSADLPAR